MSGPSIDGGEYQLYLSEVPLVAPGAPVTKKLLETFSGAHLEGSALAILPAELARIDSGMVHLEVYNVRTQSNILSADWGKVKPFFSSISKYVTILISMFDFLIL